MEVHIDSIINSDSDLFLAGAPSSEQKCDEEDAGSDSDFEIVQETDAERRHALEGSKKADDCNLGKGSGWKDFEDEFNFSASHSASSRIGLQHSDILDLTDNSDVSNGETRNLPVRSKSIGKSQGKKKQGDRSINRRAVPISSTDKRGKRAGSGLIENELQLRKKEALGLDDDHCEQSQSTGNSNTGPVGEWNCLVCTLWVLLSINRHCDDIPRSTNRPDHLACGACATPRGESTYHQGL